MTDKKNIKLMIQVLINNIDEFGSKFITYKADSMKDLLENTLEYIENKEKECKELKDTIKRFTCQSEYYKHKEAEKYKQTLKNIKSIIKPIEDGLSYHHWEEQVHERCQQILDIIDKNLEV